MERTIRYQGAILREHCILLIKHREHATGRAYWIIPGGGREAGETEEECVRREMREETHIEVTVERLLLDETRKADKVYRQAKTYLCRIASGEARPGYEPEVEVARQYAITEVGWFDLREPDHWDDLAKSDPLTFPLLHKIREALDYASGEGIGLA